MGHKQRMKDQIVPLTITEIASQGDGMAQYNNIPVFIAKTAPGDIVQAKLSGERGKMKAVLAPSPHRALPPCPYFPPETSNCGGCALQHVDANFYQDWKIEKVDKALKQAGVKVHNYGAPVFIPPHTRRRTTLTALNAGGRFILGYNEVRSHTVIDIHHCLILEPELDKRVQALRPFLPALLGKAKSCDIALQYAEGQLDVVLTGPLQDKGRFSLEQNEAFGAMMEALSITRLSWRVRDFASIETILERMPMIKKFGALRVALPPAAFLQASNAGEEALTSLVLHHAHDATKIADLFSGCGTFTGPLLGSGKSVTAVDGDGPAIAALQATKHPNLTATRRDLFKNPLNEAELSAFDLVIFDPPRAGAREQAGKLAWSGVRKIIGISCNPVTFARDAALLQEGGYKLQSLTLVDQFVYAAHIELAGLFTKT